MHPGPRPGAARITGHILALCFAVCFAAGCDVRTEPALEDAPDNIVRWLGGCRKFPTAQQDWCVVQELAGMPDPTVLTAEERILACRSLVDPDAVDVCLEQSIRFDDRVPTEACTHIQAHRLRASCALGCADRILAADGPLADALDACQATGPLRQHCAVHIVRTRMNAWIAAGYPEAMDAVGRVIADTHGVDQMDSLGQQVGELAARLGAALNEGPCEYFRDGLAHSSCRTRQHDLLQATPR